jgi:energy-coupling factor transporter ATP-binding protein EcfA2
MHIERVQIEEGFLDGLDLRLVPGLNVVIGERGTGKTSLIELIRFCLDVPGYTLESGKRSRDHALSVLGSGQVSITLRDGQQTVTAVRAARDVAPRVSRAFQPPIIFSQTEIEAVGLQAGGRLRLIDSFIAPFEVSAGDEQSAISEISSLTAEAAVLKRELDELERQITELPLLNQKLLDIVPAEQRLSTISAEAAQKKQQVDALAKEISSLSVLASSTDRFAQTLTRWRSAVSSAVRPTPPIEEWIAASELTALTSARSEVNRAEMHLDAALKEISDAITKARTVADEIATRRIPLEEKAREVRKDIEALQTGAGATMRQASQLRERKAELESLQALIHQRRQHIATIVRRRDAALDRLEAIRQRRFTKRGNIVADLNSVLAPRIRIGLSHAGQHDMFSAAITEMLRGSGLRYGELAPALAGSVSPRELLEAAESNDYGSIAEAAGITRDRAARVLAQMREVDIGALATVPIEDDVSLQLLHGNDYKDIAELSMGQRCTVVLPLILRHVNRILVVDQPEDHIDNAFIAETLIQAVTARDPSSQIIFSTHNANIPVLGNADRVVHLRSDGRRGFEHASAELDDPRIVASITTVMEGGAGAFEQRASFYCRHKMV